ncbi:MAG TPA: ASCH domain-containing protein [Anaerolineales bacterium]|nr:ASCH domain-containing protein [Anaerolineales bacterium]
MPGIDFRKRFAEMVKSGSKTQTIRKKRTPPIKTGDHLTLWTGMRTKQCEPLGDATCTKVLPVKIRLGYKDIWLWDESSEYPDSDGEIVGNFYQLNQEQAEDFVKADGFNNQDEFFEFFKNVPPDVLQDLMVVIYWRQGWDFKK